MGDKVVFYKAGQEGQKFIGNAAIDTELQEDGSIDFAIGLTDITVWKKQISISPLLKDLNFIKNVANWGAYLQGGLRLINESDYVKIIGKN